MGKLFLVALLGLGLGGQVYGNYGDSCSAFLKRGDGTIIQSFLATSYYYAQACEEAFSSCQDELDWRRGQGRNPRAYCELEVRTPPPRPPMPPSYPNQCDFELQGPGGTRVQNFRGLGPNRFEACRTAESQCQRALRHAVRTGALPYGRCVEHPTSGYPGRDLVVRSCEVARVDSTGRTVDIHIAQARGPRGSGVQRQACENALRRCHQITGPRQFCRVR